MPELTVCGTACSVQTPAPRPPIIPPPMPESTTVTRCPGSAGTAQLVPPIPPPYGAVVVTLGAVADGAAVFGFVPHDTQPASATASSQAPPAAINAVLSGVVMMYLR